MYKSYTVEVAGLMRELPIHEVAPDIWIPIVNILGDTELIHATATELARCLPINEIDYIITPEVKSILLGYALSYVSDIPFVVARKFRKVYMGETLSATVRSITSQKTQTLFLSEDDKHKITGKEVILLDDVVSTGSTLDALRALVRQAGAYVAGCAAIFTEGDSHEWDDVIALGHLPVFRKDGSKYYE